jgi:glutathione S-transferase
LYHTNQNPITALKADPPQPVRLVTKFIAGQLNSGFLVPAFTKRFNFLEAELAKQGTKYITGDELATSDIMMVFVLELCVAKAELTEKKWPLIMEYLRRLQAREAYKRAGERIEREFGTYKSVEEI